MTDLVQKIQETLSVTSRFPVHKYSVTFSDGESSAIVRIHRPDKIIYCISCMVGCPVCCPFCVSGLRYRRRLSIPEMRSLYDIAYVESHLPSLLSFMGSGEPLLNAKAVRQIFRELETEKRAISTSGVGINALWIFLGVPNLKLQLSVHSVEDDLRQRIIPNTPPLPHILNVILAIWNPRPVEWNFVFWEGLNDQPCTGVRIATWAKDWAIGGVKINAARGDLIPSSKRTQEIMEEIRSFGIKVEYYETDGEDIGAACGQLN